MPVRRGEAWGTDGVLPAGGVVVRSDADPAHDTSDARSTASSPSGNRGSKSDGTSNLTRSPGLQSIRAPGIRKSLAPTSGARVISYT